MKGETSSDGEKLGITSVLWDVSLGRVLNTVKPLFRHVPTSWQTFLCNRLANRKQDNLSPLILATYTRLPDLDVGRHSTCLGKKGGEEQTIK